MTRRSLSALALQTLLPTLLPLLLSGCLKEGPEPFCGDGQVTPGEECDCGSGASPPAGCTGSNSDLGGATCRTTCLHPFCGDGILDPGETCDGSALGGETCEGLGFTGGGALSCDAGCVFNTSDCVN